MQAACELLRDRVKGLAAQDAHAHAAGEAGTRGWVEEGGETTAHFALIVLADDNDELASYMSARRTS